MAKFILFFVFLCCFGAGIAQVKVNTVNYKGWNDAYELSNGVVRVVVVPPIGRIMHFSFAGETNVLYESKELEGKVFSASKPYLVDGKRHHAGFGGDRIWPTVQDSFEVINGARSLSDPWIDGSPWEARQLEDGVQITSQLSRFLGARVIRTITLAPAKAEVYIRQRMEKVRPSETHPEPIALTIWNLSKVKNPLFGIMPVPENSCFEQGIEFQKWPDNINSAPKNYSRHGNIGQLVPAAGLFQKMGTDSRAWVAGVYPDKVFAQFFEYREGVAYPDGGTSATIFTCTDFTELECLSPEVALQPGENIEYDICWKLHRLNAQDEAGLRQQAVEWLNKSALDR